QVRDRREPDVRVRAHVHALAGREIDRAEVVEEDERPDHLVRVPRQNAAHHEAVAEIANVRAEQAGAFGHARGAQRTRIGPTVPHSARVADNRRSDIASPGAAMTTLYDFTVDDIHGKPVNLDRYKGKVLLVVNTASECGFTPQYKGL